MFSATCNSQPVPVSTLAATDLIFVKDVALPGWFMNFTWSLFSLFTAATIVKAVAMAFILGSIAAVTLSRRFKPEKPLFIKYTESADDFIEMMDISVALVCVNKKPCPRPALDNEPVEPIKTLPLASVPLEPSPYLVDVEDLFHQSLQEPNASTRRISYADAVGYEHMEVRKPRNPYVLGYDVYIADLFGVDDDPFAHVSADESLKSNVLVNESCVQLPARCLPYADAVGYEHMEVRKPRNPYVLGYDVYIADLFELDDDHFASFPAEESLKPTVITEICVQVPVHRISYADAVGYEFMEVKKPRNPNVLGYDVYVGDLFPDDSAEDWQKLAHFTDRCIETRPDPVRRISYADAVGYQSMEVKRPRNTEVLGYDVYIADLFKVVQDSPSVKEINYETNINTCSPPVPHRLSYAEAVGYEFMETKTTRNPVFTGYDTYLGDLFAGEEIINIPPSIPARRLSYAEAVGFDNMETNRPRYSHFIESSAYLVDVFTKLEIGPSTVENHKNYKFFETI